LLVNEQLKKKLGEEQAWLQENAKGMTIDNFTHVDRRVGLKVRIAMWLVTLFGGAL
jgi:CDP-diacylglycerol--glycerol-3-phosphate 3-phosphatidyltransferase